MKKYYVQWAIDIEAESPEAAAEEALLVMRDYDSIATVFDVIDYDSGEEVQIDLE